MNINRDIDSHDELEQYIANEKQRNLFVKFLEENKAIEYLNLYIDIIKFKNGTTTDKKSMKNEALAIARKYHGYGQGNTPTVYIEELGFKFSDIFEEIFKNPNRNMLDLVSIQTHSLLQTKISELKSSKIYNVVVNKQNQTKNTITTLEKKKFIKFYLFLKKLKTIKNANILPI